jgi:hypothetical protein
MRAAVMRAAALVVRSMFVLSPISCDPVWQLSYDETERIRLDGATVIEAQLDVNSTLLVELAEVRVLLLRKGQAPLPVLETQGEAWGLRGGTLATRLGPGGAIGVHLGAELCALSPGARSFACLELVENPPHDERSEAVLRALEWLIGNPRAGDRARAQAAIALARTRAIAPPRALRAIEAGLELAEGLPHRSAELRELRALRHALAPTQASRP